MLSWCLGVIAVFTFQFICHQTQSTKHSAVDQFEELLEAREQELASFQPSSRETEADREGDLKSLCRRLDQMLYLLVKKPRSQHSWQMPQGGLEEGESLLQVCGSHLLFSIIRYMPLLFFLQAARRELAEECGSELKADFLSSAPSAFHSYRHSLTCDPGIVGTKVYSNPALLNFPSPLLPMVHG